ncbi:hypothetical protein HZA33_01200 [Candidatus Pacearchaeota archaeon]|nr:hypothetical protein [Candidatus Pacearchaeota archaeon]
MKNETLILNKLDIIKSEVDAIREHLVDITLTNDDLSALEKADEDLKKGKTKRL